MTLSNVTMVYTSRFVVLFITLQYISIIDNNSIMSVVQSDTTESAVHFELVADPALEEQDRLRY